MRRAVTILELLVVLAIIAVLAALLFPTLTPARRSAKTASAVENLKQLSGALTLYRMDWEGGGSATSDVAAPLGLPSLEALEAASPGGFATILPHITNSPCGYIDSVRLVSKRWPIFYYAIRHQDPYSFPDYKEYYQAHPDDGIIAVDANCGDPAVDIYNTRSPQLKLGLRLDGGVVRRFGADRRPMDAFWGKQ